MISSPSTLATYTLPSGPMFTPFGPFSSELRPIGLPSRTSNGSARLAAAGDAATSEATTMAAITVRIFHSLSPTTC